MNHPIQPTEDGKTAKANKQTSLSSVLSTRTAGLLWSLPNPFLTRLRADCAMCRPSELSCLKPCDTSRAELHIVASLSSLKRMGGTYKGPCEQPLSLNSELLHFFDHFHVYSHFCVWSVHAWNTHPITAVPVCFLYCRFTVTHSSSMNHQAFFPCRNPKTGEFLFHRKIGLGQYYHCAYLYLYVSHR